MYVDKLEVYCDNGIYPVINGVKPKDRTRFSGFYVYNGLNKETPSVMRGGSQDYDKLESVRAAYQGSP